MTGALRTRAARAARAARGAIPVRRPGALQPWAPRLWAARQLARLSIDWAAAGATLWRVLRALGLGATLVFTGIGLFTVVRGTPVERIGAPDVHGAFPAVGTPAFAQLFALYAGTPLTAGNRVEVLVDGDGTYPRLWADLRAARRSITVQLYYGQPGVIADSLAAVLSAAARRGVPTRLVLDDFGNQPLRRAWDDSLRAAGVRVVRLRLMRWYTLDRIASRSHVRAVVVDGVVGYTGGFGLADYWLGDGHTAGQWRETNVRFVGPAVAQLQAAFMTAWAEATGELLAGDTFYPPATRDSSGVASGGTSRAALVFTAPSSGSTSAERLLALSIAGARRRLYITNSYFLPDDDFRRFLIDAARRGVDVRVLTAGTTTDIKSVYWASHWRYERLLRAGVRIYEYQPTMMHAKTLVADGMYALVGSMNFDNRSLALNDESTLVALDEGVGAAMDALFRDDLRYAREIRLADFVRRPLWQRAVEAGASLLSPVL